MAFLDGKFAARFLKSGADGMTMVELLVSFTLVSILVGAIAPMAVRAGHYEANVRLVSFARTNLARDLERVERAVSLAERFSTGTDGALLRFPAESGGVSFETNRLAGVNSLAVAFDAGGILLDAGVARGFGTDLASFERRIAADPIVHLSGVGRYTITGFSLYAVPEGRGLLRMALSASVPQRRADGSIYYRDVSVCRYARAWNYK